MSKGQISFPANYLTDDQLFDVCHLNQDWSIERRPDGQLIFSEPSGGYTGWRNSALNASLYQWNAETGLGYVFDSSRTKNDLDISSWSANYPITIPHSIRGRYCSPWILS